MKPYTYIVTMGLLLAILSWSACTVNPCTNVLCGTHGQCTSGSCVCDVGYDFDNDGLCNVEERTKFFGTWVVQQDCAGLSVSNDSLSITTATGSDVGQMHISGAWTCFANYATAIVTNEFFTIPLQEPDNNNRTIQGSGQRHGDSIYVSFVIEQLDSLGSMVTSDTCNNILWIR